ncbi:hypothetical protein Sjap_009152 [Stephania japonica]|uniref:NB-ARC domain-containing protein n=1 Tax=Stephania japonica TaxID=461633 RepID=A0AAP0JSE1_9MAGN
MLQDAFEIAKHESSSMDSIQRALQDKLRGRRFLFVLDDMWIEDGFLEKWETLKIVLKCADRGSKIIVTTRNGEVANMVAGTSQIQNLQVLPEDDCWGLFQRRAFASGGVQMTQALEAIGRQIVKKCGGVPLAIKSLGGMMRSKREEKEWLAVKNNEIWNIPDADKKIINVLKLSFDNLPSSVKRCFSYCSIFPKGYSINKKMLIQMWMAEGFVSTSRGNALMLEDIGNQYFNILYLNSFFEEVETNCIGEIKRCKMHDLVHDLAQFVSGQESLVLSSNVIPDDISKTRYMCYISSGRRAEFPKALYNARKLHTLLSNIPYEVPREMFVNLKLLRVLDLSYSTSIKELPSSICKLKHLRYLDLSMTDIEELPESITRLYNLQTLKLKKCKKLKVLPQKLYKLINLRYLYIGGCSELSGMPKGMEHLTSLQMLSDFNVGLEEDRNSITELRYLNLLRGKLVIYGLEKVRDATYAQTANLKGKSNLSHLILFWEDMEDGVDNANNNKELSVLEALEPSCNLKQLGIEGFGGESMPTWMMNNSRTVSNLVNITFMNCSRCLCLPSFAQLPFLRYLLIVGLKNLKRFGDRGSNKLKEIHEQAVAVIGFPSLKTLVLEALPNLEEWVLEESLLLHSFPCLEDLRIEDCPKLKATPSSLFPSLKSLLIDGSSSSIAIRSITTNLSFLTFLHIGGCPDLKFLSQRVLERNRLLETLAIACCPKFEGFVEVEQKHGNEEESVMYSKTAEEESIMNLMPKKSIMVLNDLQWLEIRECPQLRSIIINTTVSLPSLKTLTIMNSNAMVMEAFSRNLTSLTYLALDTIQDLVFLPKNVLRDNIHLKDLFIANCPLLQCIFFTENNNELPLLSCLKLAVQGCHALNSLNFPLPCWSSLREAYLEDCRGLSSFPEGLSLLPHLEVLRIGQFCEDLDNFPFPDSDQLQIQIGGHHQHYFTSLKNLVLLGWPKLKSLPSQLQHLKN